MSEETNTPTPAPEPNKPHFISKKIDKLVKKGRMQAIVKEVAGRRVLVGFERNKRSRKSGVKFFTPAPIDLSSLKKKS